MAKEKKKDPKEWTELEWKNCYKLYEAVQLYDLDDSLEFDAFKERVLSDEDFRIIHSLTPGMDSENYNPWKINKG